MLTLHLRPEIQARLEADAEKRHLPIEELVAAMIAEHYPAARPQEFATGADVVDYWQREGLIGMWADREEMNDPVHYVNDLRQRIERDVRLV